MIPPKHNAEFVAAMEKTLETYHLPHDPEVPVIVMDEQPVQLFKETRTPIPATRNHPQRNDYEYERAGVANIFMLAEPLGGWRRVSVRQYKTKVDWAHEIRTVLERDYPHARRIILVNDNFSTHTYGAFYEAFPPELARSLARRIEFCYTPKHGSWLNIAENELSALTRQCVAGRRFGTIDELRREVEAWATQCNANQKGVQWQFTVDNARTKLVSLYPKIEY